MFLNLPARRCWQAALSNIALATREGQGRQSRSIKESLTAAPLRNTLKGGFCGSSRYLQIHSKGVPIAQKVKLKQPKPSSPFDLPTQSVSLHCPSRMQHPLRKLFVIAACLATVNAHGSHGQTSQDGEVDWAVT